MTNSAGADSQAAEGPDAAVAELVQKFATQLQAGEAPDPEAFVAAHPAHADRLRQLLPALRVLAAQRWGRQRQTVLLTAVLGLLLALAAVAGGLIWVVRDRAARQAEAERSVEAAVERAKDLLGQYRIFEALAVAHQAEGLLPYAGSHPRVGPQVQELLKDLRMLVTLEELRLNMSAVKDGNFDLAGADKKLAEVLRHYGIDMEALPKEARPLKPDAPPLDK